MLVRNDIAGYDYAEERSTDSPSNDGRQTAHSPPGTRFTSNDFLFFLLVFGFLAMESVSSVDYEWTLRLGALEYPALSDFIGRTMFEGQMIGAVDFSNIFIAAALFGYVWLSTKGSDARWRAWRPQFGFILVSALTTCFAMVHALKWTIGRSRPHVLFRYELDYSHWYEFGHFFITDGDFRGSFPSGHTAVAFIFMALAYVLAADRTHPLRRRLLGFFVGFLTLAHASVVGVARSIDMSHWVSDVLFSIIASWVVMHILYFNVLAVPRQKRFLDRHGNRPHPQTPAFWEIRFALCLLPVLLGAAGVLICLRAVLEHREPWLLLFFFPSAILIFLFGWLAARIRRRALVVC